MESIIIQFIIHKSLFLNNSIAQQHRRLYKKVCKDLLQLIKWKGNATAKLLVDEFKATYPRRSALLDELQKVEKKL